LTGWTYTYHSEDRIADAEALAQRTAFDPNLTLLRDGVEFGGSAVLLSPCIAITAAHNILPGVSFEVGYGQNPSEVLLSAVVVTELIRSPEQAKDLTLLVLQTPILDILPAVISEQDAEVASWVVSAGLGPSSYIGLGEYLWDYRKRASINRISTFGVPGFLSDNHGVMPFVRSGLHRHHLGSTPLRGNSGDGAYGISREELDALAFPLEPGDDFISPLPLVGIVRGVYGADLVYQGDSILTVFDSSDRQWIQETLDSHPAEFSNTVDTDGDLYDDFYEYAFGGNPYDPSVSPPPLSARIESTENGNMFCTYFLRRSAFPMRNSYFLRTSSDLVDWEEQYSAELITVQDTNFPTPPPGCEWVKFCVPVEAKGKCYVQIGVQTE
jgi:hypothetical protein